MLHEIVKTHLLRGLAPKTSYLAHLWTRVLASIETSLFFEILLQLNFIAWKDKFTYEMMMFLEYDFEGWSEIEHDPFDFYTGYVKVAPRGRYNRINSIRLQMRPSSGKTSQQYLYFNKKKVFIKTPQRMCFIVSVSENILGITWSIKTWFILLSSI